MAEMERVEPRRFLRMPQVQARVGYSRMHIYRLSRNGGFPKPVRLGPKAVAWLESEVEAWMEKRVQERNPAPVESCESGENAD